MASKEITISLEIDTEVLQEHLKIISEELSHMVQRLKSVHDNHEFATGGVVTNITNVSAVNADDILKKMNDNQQALLNVIKGAKTRGL